MKKNMNECVEKNDAGAPAVKKKRSVAGIIVSAVCRILVACLLCVAVWLLVDKFGKKSPVPMFMGIATLTVETGSMAGTIEEGDLIVIKRADEFRTGDIITFMPEGDTIPTTHRIVRIDGDKFYTKGDANNAEDTRAITKEQIIGKYEFSIPCVGLFFRWIGQEGGWLYFAGIAVVIVVGVLLLKLVPKSASANNGAQADKPDGDDNRNNEGQNE